ncbi:MAG: tripartite tricarboxylate transporter TctB family protein [Nitrospinota bacterium]
MNARQGDIISGLVALGLVAFIYIGSTNMPEGSAGFPRLIAIGLLVCSVLLVGRALLDKKASPQIFSDIHWSTIRLVGGVWIVVIFFVEALGFLIPGVFFVGLVTWNLTGRPKDGKTMAKLTAFVVGNSIVLWIVFHKLLGVESPSGFLF